MSEVKKIATRESYGNALVELGREHTDLVVLDADLAGATKTEIFKKAFPERFLDCGIAEANMAGIAAGLSTCVFVFRADLILPYVAVRIRCTLKRFPQDFLPYKKLGHSRSFLSTRSVQCACSPD